MDRTRRSLKDNRPPHGPDTTDPSSASKRNPPFQKPGATPLPPRTPTREATPLKNVCFLRLSFINHGSNLVLSAGRWCCRFKRSNLPRPLQIPSPRFLASLLFILSWYIRYPRWRDLKNKQTVLWTWRYVPMKSPAPELLFVTKPFLPVRNHAARSASKSVIWLTPPTSIPSLRQRYQKWGSGTFRDRLEVLQLQEENYCVNHRIQYAVYIFIWKVENVKRIDMRGGGQGLN